MNLRFDIDLKWPQEWRLCFVAFVSNTIQSASNERISSFYVCFFSLFKKALRNWFLVRNRFNIFWNYPSDGPKWQVLESIPFQFLQNQFLSSLLVNQKSLQNHFLRFLWDVFELRCTRQLHRELKVARKEYYAPKSLFFSNGIFWNHVLILCYVIFFNLNFIGSFIGGPLESSSGHKRGKSALLIGWSSPFKYSSSFSWSANSWRSIASYSSN